MGETAGFDEERFGRFYATLNERQRRLCAAERALALGEGGSARLSRVTGLSATTVRKGIAELRDPRAVVLAPGRVRRAGGGRKAVEVVDPGLPAAREEVGAPPTAGDPRGALRWTSKALAALAGALGERGHRVSANTVGRLLRALDYSLQANRKDKEGLAPPERDAQVRYLDTQARAFLERGRPVISVDTKKKELVGDCKNGGRTRRPAGEPVRVRVHDFPSQAAGEAIPYGVYDVGGDRGFVNVGTGHDTPDFAVGRIRPWWAHEGGDRYPGADALPVCADGGGSNSARSRLWKLRLQELADALRLPITVCHPPPGTSTWNKSA